MVTGISSVLIAILALIFMGYKYWRKKRDVSLICPLILCLPIPYSLMPYALCHSYYFN